MSGELGLGDGYHCPVCKKYLLNTFCGACCMGYTDYCKDCICSFCGKNDGNKYCYSDDYFCNECKNKLGDKLKFEGGEYFIDLNYCQLCLAKLNELELAKGYHACKACIKLL